MAKKIYWAVFGLVVVCGLAFVIYVGLKPRPVPKIKLSSFEEPGVISRALLLRLREEIKASPILVLGVEPGDETHFVVWEKFFEANQEPEMKYTSLVLEKDLGHLEMYPGAQPMVVLEEGPVIAAAVKAAVERGERVAILVPTTYSSQLVYGNFVEKLKAELGTVPVTSISLSWLPRNRQDEKQVPTACVVEGVDQKGTGPLGCMVLQMARNQYRKKQTPGQLVGIAEQVGLRDYLVLFAIEK